MGAEGQGGPDQCDNLSPAFLRGTQHQAGLHLPWWVTGASSCPSWGLSRAKPAWLRGGTPPTRATVDGEGKSTEVGGCEEVRGVSP